jgi:hypothetical protein
MPPSAKQLFSRLFDFLTIVARLEKREELASTIQNGDELAPSNLEKKYVKAE